MARAQTVQPEPLLRPGWWWWDFGAEQTDAFHAFALANHASFRTVTTWQSNDRAIVVFQVHAPMRWTLGGKPARASQGAKTTLTDLVRTPAPSPGFVVAVEQITGQSYARLRRSAAVGGAGLLLWGGALGLLAWNLFTPAVDDKPPKKGD